MKHLKQTLKSINAVLPRFDTLRKGWMRPGIGGWMTPCGILESAIIDLDEDGNAEDLTLYASGDAMYRRHYFGEGDGETSFVITPILWDVLTDEPEPDARKYRRYICWLIQQAILSYNDHPDF